MKTREQREKHFRDELKALLNRHGAELIIDGYDALCKVQMACIYDDDSGDLLAEYCEFNYDE